MGGESSGDEDKSEHDSEGEEENAAELRNASTMDWLGEEYSVNGDEEGEELVPALPPLDGTVEEVVIEGDLNQNAGGGTAGSESGTLTDQQSVMNVSNRMTHLSDYSPNTNEFN